MCDEEENWTTSVTSLEGEMIGTILLLFNKILISFNFQNSSRNSKKNQKQRLPFRDYQFGSSKNSAINPNPKNWPRELFFAQLFPTCFKQPFERLSKTFSRSFFFSISRIQRTFVYNPKIPKTTFFSFFISFVFLRRSWSFVDLWATSIKHGQQKSCIYGLGLNSFGCLFIKNSI